MEWDTKYRKYFAIHVPWHGKSIHHQKYWFKSGRRFQQVISLIGIGLFFASLLWGNSSRSTQIDLTRPTTILAPNQASWLTPAPPITISGDAGWITCPWVNGSGTWGDPYTLRNLTIDAGGSGNCISITNTDKVFSVVNCTLTGSGTTTWDAGIYLYNTGNGTLYNNTCYANNAGINLRESENITLIYNNCSGNVGGIGISSGMNNTLFYNNCSWNSENGIGLGATLNNTLTGNNCSGNSVIGINLSSSNNTLINNNTCMGNSQEGIWLWMGNNNTLVDNKCIGNGNAGGIKLEQGSNSNSLEDNYCSENAQNGIALLGSRFNNITGNNCSGQGTGIGFYSASNNTIINNTCTGNSWGINVQSSNNITLTSNNCTANFNGIYIAWGNNNTLVSNNCSLNTKSGINLTSSSGNIISQNTCSRNDIGIGFDVMSYYNEVYQNWLKKSISSPFTSYSSRNNVHDNFVIYLPSAAFTANYTTIIAGQSVGFTDTSTDGIGAYSYQWNFGDVPGNDTNANVVHQYTSSGTWNTTLTIMDAEGDLSVTQQLIQVQEDLQPVAVITPTSLSIALGTVADFYATPTGNSPVNYTWGYGDGTSPENGTHVAHLYTTLGIFTVTLNVTDADGDFATTTIQVEIINTLPSIEHLNPISVFEGATGNQIKWHPSDPNTNNPTYSITRDGLTILSGPWIPNATVVVDLDGLAEGTYTFTLSINDGYGGITVESVIVTVTPPPAWGLVETLITVSIAGVGLVVVVILVRKFRSKP